MSALSGVAGWNRCRKEAGIQTYIRANNRIRAEAVRCIGPDGQMLGIMSVSEALKHAHAYGLDLVEISPSADPPVCKIMDMGKYLYELSRRVREARKHQHSLAVKEIKFRVNIAPHDYETKLKHVNEFLEKGHKVKVSLQFRGREIAHSELGFGVINNVLKDASARGQVESEPRMQGRTIVAVLSPRSAKGGRAAEAPAQAGAAPPLPPRREGNS